MNSSYTVEAVLKATGASEFQQAFANASESLGGFEKVSKNLGSIGKKMTKGITVPVLGAGAASVKMAADFESGMSEVAALSGATGSDLQMLEDKAREMGASTKYSATEASEGLQYMALAGWDAEQMAAGLEPSLLLAGAAGMELGQATDIVTDTMSMFGMEAEEATKMTDMLAYAQANSNTDVSQLGEALVNVGANANAMGYDLADTSAILGTFADQGLKGGKAGTALSAIFRDMKKNAKDGAIAIGDTSVAIQDSEGNYRDMVDIIADIESATDGMSDAQRDAALSTTFGDQAISGMNMALAAGSDEIANFEEGIRSSDGAAKDMYDTMQDNLMGSFENLKSAISEAAISIGDALIPTISKVVDKINEWVDRFNGLDDSTKETIVKIGLMIAAIGPLLIIAGKVVSIVGTVSGVIGVLTTGAAAATPMIGGLATAFTILSGPVGAVVLGLGAVVGAGALLVNHLSKDAIPEVNLFGDEVSDSTAQAVEGFMEMTEGANIALKELSWGQQEVTTEMANDMKSKQEEITQSLIGAIEERNEQEKTMMIDQFAKTSALTEQEQAQALEKMQERFDKEQQTTEEGHERINQIVENAAEEGRAIRQDEADEILYIRESMNIQAVEMMSQNELEQKAILEQMRINAGTITAQEAAEVVQNATEKKDAVIAEANQQYDETVAWAIQQRDEHGTLSAGEAARVIEEATYQRDESVSAAEGMHQDVVAEAQAQAGEHIDAVDWETGEVLSKWEVFKNNMGTKLSELGTTISTHFSNYLTRTREDFGEIKDTISSNWSEGLENTKTNLRGIGTAISTHFSGYITRTKGDFESIRSTISEKMESAKESVSGAVESIKSFFDIDLYASGKAMIDSVWSGISSAKDNLISKVSGIAGSVRDLWPFSPAKEGPLKDIDKMDFAGPIGKSIDNAKRPIHKSMVGLAGVANSSFNPHIAIGGRIASSNAQVKSIVSHEINNGHSKQPANLTVQLGKTQYRAFIEDINNAQAQNIQFEESYSL